MSGLPLSGLAVTSSPGWRERWQGRWQAWRDRLLTSPEFQRRAARSWWMRPIARRRAAALFDIVAGFVYSQVLLACVRLDLFELLKSGPKSAAELARRTDVPAEAMQRLLAAAVALDLVQRRQGEHFGLGALGAAVVANQGIAAMVEHHALLYGDLHDPVALLRSGGAGAALSEYWAYATAARPGELPAERVDDYSALMSASQPLIADEVLDSYDFSRHRCVLDVGGGQGRFLAAVARRNPGLSLMLFDLPGVVPVAQQALAAQGLLDRTTVHGGDFTRDALPHGADLVTLVRVLYDHPDARVLALLRAVLEALPSGGHVLVAEPMAGALGARRMGDAYFGMYLLAMRGGRPRSPAGIATLLRAAGFEQVREMPTPIPLQVGVVVARKPARPPDPGRT